MEETLAMVGMEPRELTLVMIIEMAHADTLDAQNLL